MGLQRSTKGSGHVEQAKDEAWLHVGQILSLTDGAALHDMVEEFDLDKEGRKLAFGAADRLRTVVHSDPSINFYEEKSQDVERVLNIFVRLNSGGTTLSYSNLLLSIATAQWKKLDDVLEEGLICGLHRIERLMRQNALKARPKRRRKPQDDGERSVIADNVLDRDFEADRPNQKWLADFTYIWTAQGWLYVAVVLDLFSRRVVGWSMKAERDATLVMDALMMAVWRRGKADALLHHSDQGSQYTSEQFQRLLADNGITWSMSRAGNVWDNSAMESFFSSLKIERTNRKVYRTRDEARADVFDYIERFYNPRRRHSKLGYISPMEFEARAMLA